MLSVLKLFIAGLMVFLYQCDVAYAELLQRPYMQAVGSQKKDETVKDA
jgi:hypothetical protein